MLSRIKRCWRKTSRWFTWWGKPPRAAPLHSQPVRFSPLDTELLFGEIVEVLSSEGEWSKVRNARDSYEGYIQSATLSDTVLQPTHKVRRLHSLIYTTPDFKTCPITHLPFMSLVTPSGDETNGFSQLSGGRWIWTEDIISLDIVEKDFVHTAERYIGTPYLWGGRTDRGLDCSALIQLSLLHAGRDCPRDSGDQKSYFKDDIEFGDPLKPSGLKRGDLVFLERHIGIMMDEERFVNATSRTMDVRIESIYSVAPQYTGGVLAVKRLSI